MLRAQPRVGVLPPAPLSSGDTTVWLHGLARGSHAPVFDWLKKIQLHKVDFTENLTVCGKSPGCCKQWPVTRQGHQAMEGQQMSTKLVCWSVWPHLAKTSEDATGEKKVMTASGRVFNHNL